MQKLLLVFIMMAIWMVASCTPRMDSNGCYGYWYDPGLKRGTLLKNQKYISPYRQCVDDDEIHLNKEQRPNG